MNYTPQEQKAYDEGKAARLAGDDYLSSPYMVEEGRDLYLLCAFSEGWLEGHVESTDYLKIGETSERAA